MTSTESSERVISMFIDEKKKYTPFESRNFKNNIIIICTDHCTANSKIKLIIKRRKWKTEAVHGTLQQLA